MLKETRPDERRSVLSWWSASVRHPLSVWGWLWTIRDLTGVAYYRKIQTFARSADRRILIEEKKKFIVEITRWFIIIYNQWIIFMGNFYYLCGAICIFGCLIGFYVREVIFYRAFFSNWEDWLKLFQRRAAFYFQGRW